MSQWLERLVTVYLIARTLGGFSLFLLVAFLIIRDMA